MKKDKRFLSGIIVGFTGYFAMMAGGIWLLLLLISIVVVATKEYSTILTNKGFFPSRRVILASSILFLLVAYLDRLDLFPLIFVICSMSAFMCVLFRGKQPYIANVATNLLGIVYCGLFPSHLILLRNFGDVSNGFIPHTQGAGYCFLLLIAVLLTDSFCYFVGCKFGKHKLSPVISPNKTIEGSIGGIVACLAFTMIIGIMLGIEWYHTLVLGLLISIFAQIGDLCESMIKRDAGVKDSSDALPGHGGFLDRTDSYIMTMPVVYYYLYYFVNNNFLDMLKGLF